MRHAGRLFIGAPMGHARTDISLVVDHGEHRPGRDGVGDLPLAQRVPPLRLHVEDVDAVTVPDVVGVELDAPAVAAGGEVLVERSGASERLLQEHVVSGFGDEDSVRTQRRRQQCRRWLIPRGLG